MTSPRPIIYNTKTERSKSFNGQALSSASDALKRPRTVPNLLTPSSGSGSSSSGVMVTTKTLTKVLLNVRIEGSVGAVQVLVSLDNNVEELIKCVVMQYIKEARRPLLFLNDVFQFDLHYSQFTLQCLDREEKLATLGSRNFFMCKRRKDALVNDISNGCNIGDGTTSTCLKQAEKAAKFSSLCRWLQFMS